MKRINRVLALFLCVAMALSVFPLQVFAVESDDQMEIQQSGLNENVLPYCNSDVEAYSPEKCYYVTDDAPGVFMMDYEYYPYEVEYREYLTSEAVDQIAYFSGMLYYSVSDKNQIKQIDLATMETKTVVSTESVISRFAVSEDGLFYLCNDTIYYFDRKSDVQQVLIAEPTIQRFWLADDNTLEYIASDDETIEVFNLSTQTTAEKANNTSELNLDEVTTAGTGKRGITIESLKSKFPHGKYWNHVGQYDLNVDGYTNSPCTCDHSKGHHPKCDGHEGGSCTCNCFDGAIQCMGYALKVAYDYYGSSPRSWSKVTNLNSLKAGDYIRYKNNGHSIWVTGVNGDTITYTDCNSTGKCQIRWQGTISKSTVLSSLTEVRVAPTASSENSYANLGENFYAVILNYECWKPISQVDFDEKIYLDTERGIARQKWHFARQSDGAYIITSCYDGKALEMTDGIREVGTQLTAHAEWGGYYQQWYLIPQGNGYIFQSKHYSDEQWVMDLYGAYSGDGNVIQINHRNNSTAQIWSIYAGDEIQLHATVLSASIDAPTVSFSWENRYGAKEYSLRIWKDELWVGDSYYTNNTTNRSATIDLPPGTYYAYVDTIDYYQYFASNILTLVVPAAQQPVNPQISVSKTSLCVGEEITMEYSGLTDCSEVVFNYIKDGEIYYSQESTSSRTYTTWFENPGEYQISVSGYLNGKWYESGRIDVVVYDHGYNYSATTAPTTSDIGAITGVCSRCGDTTTIILPTLDTTNYNYAVVTAATCTANGTGRYTWKTTTYGTFTFDVAIPKTGHSYTYAVTTAPTTSAAGVLTGTCSKCSGKTTVTLPKLTTTDYNYSIVQAATCTTNGTGRYTWRTTTYGTFSFDVTIPKTGHSYTYTVTTAPTTSATGILTGTCSKCSGKTTVTLPKLNTTDYNYSVVTEATCTANGTRRYTWKTTTYGTFTFDVTIPKTGHSYTYAVTTAPTTSATGVLTGTCSKCGNKTTVTLPKLSTTDYTYSVVTAATCTANGTGRYTWKTTTYGTFKFDVSIPKTGHSYTYAVTTAPTTSATGVLTGTCSKCGGTTTVTLPKLDTTNYNYAVVTAAACTANGTGRYTWKTTTYGTFTFDVTIPKTGHSYTYAVTTTPTTSAAGVLTGACSKCGSITTVALPKLDTTNYNYTVVTAATCTANGTGRYTWKTTTYGTFTFDVSIPKTNHSYIYAVTKAPTTSATGTLTGTCANCGGTTTVTLPKLNTTDYTYSVVTAATCTATGTGRYTWKTTTYGTFSFDVTIAKTAHNYVDTVTAPTCTEQGYTTYTCSVCGDTYKDTYIAALGHYYQASVTAPTCTAGGYTTYTCARCGDSYVGDYTNALGHKLGAAVEENRVSPTCTGNGGFDTVTYCTVCGTELSRVHTNLSALGHVWDDGVIEPAPSCTSDGVKTYTCQRCGETKTEAIAATGHTAGEAKKENELAATCTTAGGYDMVIRCTICKAILYTEHFEIAALGHDYQAIVTAPICTESGYTTYTCSRCGDSYMADETAALGHTSGEPVKEKDLAPTCEVAGGYDMVVYCTICGAEISREHTDVAAIGHDWNEPEYVWANDYSTVTATRACKKDTSHEETETVNTTSEVTKEATYEAEGEITYTATFENEAFATQAKAVVTPKLEKPDDPKPYNPFEDVKEGAYYYDAVLWAVNANPQITAGTSATTFSPNDTCTRAQVVTFLWRAMGQPEPTKTDNPFKDVKSGAYYYKAVLWAVENGITAGTSSTTFSPNQGCTRAQVVTFLWRTHGQPEPTSSNNPFKDVTGGYYYTAVLWAVENKITAGTSATTFSPNQTCTRGQIVTFLYRDLAG